MKLFLYQNNVRIMRKSLSALLRLVLPALLLLSAAQVSRAQFYPGGGDPGALKWKVTRTKDFKLIYPLQADSLAAEYLSLLEKYRPIVGISAGMAPCSLDWGRTPVILHPFSIESNGSVVWTPKRMELYTIPEPYGAEAMPWSLNLAIHESRHLAQMQFAYRGAFKPLNWIFGEAAAGVLDGIYPDPALLEGDAVTIETALTSSGRGRTASFLNYYAAAFDNGDTRNWYRWRYGSYRHYAPDYYALGYMTVAGSRYLYDEPLFTKRYFDNVVRHPFRIGQMQKTVREISGKRFRESFRDIQDTFHAIWQEEAEARKPFMPMTRVTGPTRFATDYSGGTWAGERHYIIREGKDRGRSLVVLDEAGNESFVSPFAGSTSGLVYDPARERLYWSESVRDIRWSLAGKSIIRYMEEGSKKKHDLTSEGRLFNPWPFPDGDLVCCVEYPAEGGSAVVIVSADDGMVMRRYPAPDGLQLTEGIWSGGYIYAIGLESRGYGLWRHPAEGDGAWVEVSEPSPKRMENLGGEGDFIEYVSDLGGTDELYYFYPATGKTFRLTSTPYGALDFGQHEVHDTLYYSAMSPGGLASFKTALSDLSPVEVDPSKVHTYRIADTLSAQERALGALTADCGGLPQAETGRYRKLPHLLKFHSWLPLWADYEEIEELSGDISSRVASPGVTGYFQNELGTASGYVGYSFHSSPYEGGKWMHGAHAKLTYTGLYPILEASLDFNDREAHQQNVTSLKNVSPSGNESLTITMRQGFRLGHPSVVGNIKAYIPFDFSKGGLSKGLVPQVALYVSNDIFNTSVSHSGGTVPLEGSTAPSSFTGADEGRLVPYTHLTLSTRGYIMRGKGASQAYPRLGIGAEAGIGYYPGISRFLAPNLFAYAYAYLPGITRTQGLKLTATWQHHIPGGMFSYNSVSTVPRGMGAFPADGIIAASRNQLKITADYAIPIYFGDLSFLSPLTYITHFTLTPFADIALYGKDNLVSVGADLTASLSNLLFFPVGASAGLRFHYFTGSGYSKVPEIKRTLVNLIFDIDF